MNYQLGVNGAYNRSKDFGLNSKMAYKNKDYNAHQKSARATELENEITSLKGENSNLKKELMELRETTRQIFSESSHEKFDERRINMIKFQVIQLERQIAILSDALGSRSEAILEVENAMSWLADKLRSYLASEVQGPMISMSRKDLIALIEGSESSRIKLFKCAENVNKDQVGKELLILNPFLAGQEKNQETQSLLDVCLQGLDHLNLRRVAQTESKLCNLYKELVQIHNQLEYLQGKADHDLLLTAHIAPSEMERTQSSLLKTCITIKDAADDLLAISLLCPSAPWPVLKTPISKEISVERVLEALPPLPSSKEADVSQTITSSLGVCNHRLHLKGKETAALKEEIAFHQKVYNLQMQHTQTVLDAIRAGYQEFEDTVRNVLSKPVKRLLEAYEHLKTSASETALRNILLIFKENETQLSSIVEMLDNQGSENENLGHKALSQFGEEFMSKVDGMVKSHKKHMAPYLKEKREVKEEQSRLDTQLRHLIEDLERKYEKQWVPGYKKNHQSLLREDQSIYTDASQSMKENSGNADKSRLCFEDEDSKPSGLRAFLDDDYKRSEEEKSKKRASSSSKGRKSKLSTEISVVGFHVQSETEDSGQHPSILDSRSSNICELKGSERIQDAVKSPAKKKGSKTSCKPRKDWVDEFSTSTSVSDNRESASRLSSIDQQTQREESFQNDKNQTDEDVLSLPQLSKKKLKKKDSLTYEPNLSVAQRTLNLKRVDLRDLKNTKN